MGFLPPKQIRKDVARYILTNGLLAGDLIGRICFYVLTIAVGLTFSAVAATAATRISTDIFTGGTLTVTSLSTFGNASSTLSSATNGLWVGSSGATSIFGSATSTFGAGISATYLNLSGTSASSTAANGINLTAGCFAVNGTCVGGVGTTTSNTWGSTQTFTSNPVLGSLTGLIAGNSGTLYQVASSSIFGFTPISNALAKGYFLVGNDAGTAQATSTISISSTGDITPVGRLILPMGEINYFNTTGTTVTIASASDGSTNLVKVAPTTVLSDDVFEFDNGGANDGRLRYTGATTKMFHTAFTISMDGEGAGTNLYVFGVAKNGVVASACKVIQSIAVSSATESTALHCMVSLATNDYIELYAGNLTDTDDIIVKTINLFAMGL